MEYDYEFLLAPWTSGTSGLSARQPFCFRDQNGCGPVGYAYLFERVVHLVGSAVDDDSLASWSVHVPPPESSGVIVTASYFNLHLLVKQPMLGKRPVVDNVVCEGRLSKVSTIKSNGPPVDRRVRRTRAALQLALIDLVEERELSQIGVADVVNHAEVNRSTFYDHYQDVHELAEAASTSMIDRLIGVVLTLGDARATPSGSPEDPDPALTAFFAHFAEHAGLYRRLLGPTGSARVIDHIRMRTMAAVHASGQLPATDDAPSLDLVDASTAPHDVRAAFVASALIGVATDWLQRGCPRTPVEMTALTKPLLRSLADCRQPGSST